MRARWWCRVVLYPSPVPDMPSSNASYSFFSGRVLDDPPVISSIINICLLVKVGWRLSDPHTHTHTHTHTRHTMKICFSHCYLERNEADTLSYITEARQYRTDFT